MAPSTEGSKPSWTPEERHRVETALRDAVERYIPKGINMSEQMSNGAEMQKADAEAALQEQMKGFMTEQRAQIISRACNSVNALFGQWVPQMEDQLSVLITILAQRSVWHGVPAERVKSHLADVLKGFEAHVQEKGGGDPSKVQPPLIMMEKI